MPRQTYRLRDYQTTSFERSLAGFALPPDSPMLLLLPSALIVVAMALLFSRFRRSTGFRAVFDLLNACVIAVLLNSAIHLIVSALGLGGAVDWAAGMAILRQPGLCAVRCGHQRERGPHAGVCLR